MIIHWECLEEMDRLIEQWVVVDSIICDIPYWTTACKWDTIIPFGKMWERLNKLIKPNWAIVLFGSEPFSSALRMSNIKNYKYDWIWNKNKGSNPMLAKKQPMKSHEVLSIFYNKSTLYNPQMRDGKPYKARKTASKNSNVFGIQDKVISSNNGDGKLYPLTSLHFNREFRNQDQFHPTQKPVALMEYLIKTYTHENETVLDFTMWSWTTWVACKNTWRDFIWIELDEWYYNIANERIYG